MLSAVRNGQKVPLTCPDCECRLNTFSYDKDTVVAHHFAHQEEQTKDAQGHKCKSIGRVWTLPSREVQHLI